MPWWGKSSSKDEKKKANKESIIDAIQRKFRNATEDKGSGRSRTGWRRSRDVVSLSRVPSRSPSPSTLVSRCQSFAERSHAQPLPLPIVRSHSGVSGSAKSGSDAGSKHLQVLPVPKAGGNVSNRLDRVKLEVDIGTASVSSDSDSDSEDQSDSRLLSPLTSDYENGNRTAANSPSSMTQKDCSPLLSRKNSGEILKHSDFSLSNQLPSVSPRRAQLSSHVQNLQIPSRGTLFSAPDSSLSSPSRSPIRAFGTEQVVNTGLLQGKHYADVGLLGSGHCSSPGSGYNSGQNSIGGELAGQVFWPNSECSPIPSPRMTSPGPSSRVQSGAVTPQHPRARGGLTESPRGRQEDCKQQSHRLPVPPIIISNTCPFSPGYSAATSPSLPRSPNRPETPTSPGSRWKKGRPLGRGTFGDVFLGFNSESGEMCAMKEVTLFSDDAKSRESVQQLGQEITMLSRLRHPNIVQYYGTETVEDKLYIYLEYVSGGSIYKLLQDYGAFGEIAIRTFTKQILSGLAYLHGKNTVHRDIKGANILVDPSGRVKVADFGMAKHITGQSCPLSFKGSPYWMAPEVIKNSTGCNLAVDIWSLGCTVLEMASGKPPWSQYEGVAAMFKIGNSRELPAIPDHLSDDGKDFIMQCLQRNPSRRPTASKLLEHPFVKNIAPSERIVMNAESSEITATGRLMGIVHARSFDTEAISIHQSGASRTGSGFSDFHSPRNNISCPVSPIGSPLQYTRSPQHMMSGMRSPSPISSPHAASGASTPLSGGGSWQPASFIHETSGMALRSQNGFYTGSTSPYREPNPDMFRQGLSQTSHIFRDMSSVDNNGGLGNRFGQFGCQDLREVPTSQPVLADRVSQQLLRDIVRLKPSLDLNPSSQGDYMHQRSS
ncbi:Mitogen-activated protein kinase kinase kinase YODA [Linum grandiflorum]